MSVVRRSVASTFAIVLLSWGCGGSTTPGSPSTSGGSGGVGGSTGSGGGGSDNLSGTWQGYVENFKFNDMSDGVTLTLGNAPPSGTAIFGDSPPLAPPTDPNVGYPPSLQLEPMRPSMSAPYPGFGFTLMQASLDGQRLQFDIAPTELWTKWCELQTPILDEVNAGMSYSCVHNWATSFGGPQGCSQTDPATRQEVPIDCGKLALCQFAGVCGCTAQGCTVGLVPSVHFDLVVATTKADGSVKGLDGSLHNVHFTKKY